MKNIFAGGLKNMKTKFNKKAFTLVELLIVIAIIGILFVVLVSKVDFATDKASTTGVQTDFRSFQIAFETVSREKAGFNSLGWDTGDNAGGITKDGPVTIGGVNYTYANADKDGGDRVRNSYDKGDMNLNGICEEGETWTGQKLYTETWTGIYTLDNPADADDKSAYIDLEKAINTNLDPALRVSIDPENKTIYMANGYQDPWKTEYHGFYLTNAAVDGKDRGAIVMYSDGPNKVFGSEQTIANGIVTVTVKNGGINGQDDLALVTCYTYNNGYGEVATMTEGFSNNQQFLTGNGGNVGNAVTPGENGGTLQLPAENPTGDLQNYFDAEGWSSIKALAQANLSKDDYKNKYGVEPGDTIVSNGTPYVLVDLGCDDDGDGVRDNYAGFVFMYNTNVKHVINPEDNDTNAGGYGATEMRVFVDELYKEFEDTNSDLYNAIKRVDIITNDGKTAYLNSIYIQTVKNLGLFLPSAKEVGIDVSAWSYNEGVILEGDKFDYFTYEASSRVNFELEVGISSTWWLRTTVSSMNTAGYGVTTNGNRDPNTNSAELLVVPCFVIG
jgi:prepilin-type N-terminal cleavage/methylation domain-containing protein